MDQRSAYEKTVSFERDSDEGVDAKNDLGGYRTEVGGHFAQHSDHSVCARVRRNWILWGVGR